MKGKRVIITGPTSGIGREIATQLAAQGADLVLACRDTQRGEQVAEQIARRTHSNKGVVLHVDTSSPQSIREFARQCRERFSRVDVLINNAGIYQPARLENSDGVELTFATNVLGYYLLTQELLGLLRRSVPARIVNVASSFATDPDLDDLQFVRRPYEGRNAYSQSKACDRMLTWAFARRLEGSGVTVNAMVPGLIQTRLYRNTTVRIRLILRVVGIFRGRSVAQGADTAVWLASAPEFDSITGRFFEERREIPCKFRNVEAEEKLWGICDRLTN
jgi:NAD(P)-dependent dehydrogenase (short-subunit alcohol dehydrogenase family)